MATKAELYYNKHKAAADRILRCEPSDYAQILGLKEPISLMDARKAFDQSSNLLSPECSVGNLQYDLAQEAHDCKHIVRSLQNVTDVSLGLWKAARSYGVDMTEYFGDNENPPSFDTSDPAVQCDHCDRVRAEPMTAWSDEGKNHMYKMMNRTIKRILECDPEDYELVLHKGHYYRYPEYEQDNHDFSFIQQAVWTSPFMLPYWKAGDFFEQQKKAFKGEFDPHLVLGSILKPVVSPL